MRLQRSIVTSPSLARDQLACGAWKGYYIRCRRRFSAIVVNSGHSLITQRAADLLARPSNLASCGSRNELQSVYQSTPPARPPCNKAVLALQHPGVSGLHPMLDEERKEPPYRYRCLNTVLSGPALRSFISWCPASLPVGIYHFDKEDLTAGHPGILGTMTSYSWGSLDINLRRSVPSVLCCCEHPVAERHGLYDYFDVGQQHAAAENGLSRRSTFPSLEKWLCRV